VNKPTKPNTSYFETSGRTYQSARSNKLYGFERRILQITVSASPENAPFPRHFHLKLDMFYFFLSLTHQQFLKHPKIIFQTHHDH